MTTRPATPTDLLVGVDVGGTKVAALVVDGAGRVLARVSEPTALDNPAATLRGIAAVVRHAVAATGADLDAVAAIGLGVPGRVDSAAGVVRQAVNLRWEEVAVGAWLAADLGAPCFLANDARGAALGLSRHPRYGGGSLAYISVGTGIGAGVILDGRLYAGAHGMAGEIGHLILDPRGPRCECGSRGCLEALAAGPAVARLAAQAIAAGAETCLRGASPLTAQAVYEAAGAGDSVAASVAETVGAYLGQAVQGLVMTYDVERVIFGGGVSRGGAAFFGPIERTLDRLRADSPLAREMLPPGIITLLPPDYEAGLWGAVALAADGLARGPAAGRDSAL
jgi:glucokinase